MTIPLPRSPRRRLALEFLLYAALTALMLHATWLTWPDAFVDFSRELYLPWRVSCGDVLYRDLAYDFGPLSVYANAALFALLGHPSVHALFALNFVFWTATLLALRAILRRIASPLAATVAVASFILLFSFSRYTPIGNYNFIAPYSHDLTRGFLFALLAILSLDSALRRLPGAPPFPLFVPRFSLAGILFALVLFTKPELALAATAAVALLFALHAIRRRTVLLRPLLAFSLSAVVTGSLVVLPFAVAFQSVRRAFLQTFLQIHLAAADSSLVRAPFYAFILGTDAPLGHGIRMLRGAVEALLPFVLAFFALTIGNRPGKMISLAILAALAAVIGWFAFFDLNAALPLAPAILLFLLGLSRKKGCRAVCPAGNVRHGYAPSLGDRARNTPLLAAFALFAFILSLKIFLNAGIKHYGFVLALPAFCCAVAIAFRPSRRLLLAAILFAAFSSRALLLAAETIRPVSVPVHDASWRATPAQAAIAGAVLSWIRENTPPDSSLAVFPTGSVLNVLARRPNSTPYAYLRPEDLLRFGQSTVLDAYRNSPPDTVVLLNLREDACFGIDYAQDFVPFFDSLYATEASLTASSPSGPFTCVLIARKK